uniref:non-specific serine/threonine protein kinase n=1 Tax=Catharus ustulatus TaxID=91951 RepID=A0A8C3VA59_CATUS
MGVAPESWGLEVEKCGCPEMLGSRREHIGVARMPNTWRLALLRCPGCWGLGGHFAVVKLARHVRCMKLVQHPNVVRLYEVIDTHAKLYLILELGDGGDMFDHIMRHEGGLAEPRAKHYFAQIVHAISYCHKLHVVHRDLKELGWGLQEVLL